MSEPDIDIPTRVFGGRLTVADSAPAASSGADNDVVLQVDTDEDLVAIHHREDGAWTKYTLPHWQLHDSGRVTDTLSSARDTGLNWQETIHHNHIFMLMVVNEEDHASSGTFVFSGKQINNLVNATAGTAFDTTNDDDYLAFPRGRTGLYRLGIDSSGNLLMESDTETGDDIELFLYRWSKPILASN